MPDKADFGSKSAENEPARPPLRLRNSINADYLPQEISVPERFRLAVQAGFEGAEILAPTTDEEADEVRQAAAATGLKVHSVKPPLEHQHRLGSADQAEARCSVAALCNALNRAHFLGADTVLLIPGKVNASTSYADNYARTQERIRNEILPMAEQYGIVLALENTWNGFLLSPIELMRYIDEFESPWIRPYLDVGNMVFGHPEHWIRIAGNRTVKLHIKDFMFDQHEGRFGWKRVGDGTVDWKRVCLALAEVGFSGWVTSAGPPHLIPARAVAKGSRMLNSVGLHGVPGVRPVLGLVLSALVGRSIADMTERFNRHLQ